MAFSWKYLHWVGLASLLVLTIYLSLGYFNHSMEENSQCVQEYIEDRINSTILLVEEYLDEKKAIDPEFQLYIYNHDSLVYWNNRFSTSIEFNDALDTSFRFQNGGNWYHYHRQNHQDDYSWTAIYPIFTDGIYYGAKFSKPACLLAGKTFLSADQDVQNLRQAVKIHPVWIWLYIFLSLLISFSFAHFISYRFMEKSNTAGIYRKGLLFVLLLVFLLPTLYHPIFKNYWLTKGFSGYSSFSLNAIFLITLLSGIIILINSGQFTRFKFPKRFMIKLPPWLKSIIGYLLISFTGFLTVYLIHHIILFTDKDLVLEELYRLQFSDFTYLIIYLLIFSIFFNISQLIYRSLHGSAIRLPNKLFGIVAGLITINLAIWLSPVTLNLLPVSLAYLIYVILLDLYQDRRSLNSTWAFTWMIVISAFLALIVFDMDLERDIEKKLISIEDIILESDPGIVSGSKTRNDIVKQGFTIIPVALNNEVIEDWGQSMIRLSDHILFNPLSGSYISVEKDSAYLLLPGKILSKNGQDWLRNEKYALFQNERLIFNHGSAYDHRPEGFELAEETSSYKISDGTIHIITKGKSNLSLIQYLDFPGLLRPFSLFSLFFFILSILLFLLSLINSFIKFIPDHLDLKLFQKNSLRSRIQISIISLLIGSFLVIGLISNYYLNSLARESNKGIQVEHAEQIKTQLSQIVQNADPERLADELAILVFSHFQKGSDLITLFKKDGHKVEHLSFLENNNSSLSAVPLNIYQELRIQDNKKIFQHNSLHDQGVFFTVQGGQRIEMMAYIPGKPMLSGSKKISDILATFLSIYTLLFILSGFIAIGLSNSITQPIKLLGKKLKSLKLSKKNEPVQWKNEDEIGTLISIYNEMIQKLSDNAKVMAKVERDSAWKEMAKQVAHEIKNPLTPLKLNIQYLETKIRMNPESAHELIGQITPGLIEQIDNLSQIASEFSNFAQLPTARNEKLRLNEIVKTVHDFFRKREDLQFQLFVPINDILVFADRNHLVRILNNVVKNAIQAIPAERDGEITLRLYKKGDDAIIQVTDNGKGIPDDMHDKVFSPNFTTKSSGTGLGLAISLNMLESFNGRIYFETEEGKGTDFYIEIPLMRLEDNYAGDNKVFLDD